MAVSQRKLAKLRRHRRVRKRVWGTAERPRLCVTRSNMNIYAQIVDDTKGVTLAQASTIDRELRESITKGGDIEAAAKVGELVAKRAAVLGIKQVVFDRGGNLYHGRVKALAEAARSGGLEF